MSISLLELSPAAQKQVLEKLKAKQAAGALRPPAKAKGNKLNAEKTNGYDSKKESKRAAELRMMEQAGEISNLREQVKFELIPAQYEGDVSCGAHCAPLPEVRQVGADPSTALSGGPPTEGCQLRQQRCRTGDKIPNSPPDCSALGRGGLKRGKLIERSCSYVADFVYEQGGKTVVEDVKGYKKGSTYAVFTIKRKLMLQKYGIRVKEV